MLAAGDDPKRSVVDANGAVHGLEGLYVADGSLFKFWDEGDALETGEEKTFHIPLPKGAATFKATLVWTDPPGETLQNDLDLIAKTAHGTERHGNMRGGASGFAAGAGGMSVGSVWSGAFRDTDGNRQMEFTDAKAPLAQAT